jgi:hypothetical protein
LYKKKQPKGEKTRQALVNQLAIRLGVEADKLDDAALQ